MAATLHQIPTFGVTGHPGTHLSAGRVRRNSDIAELTGQAKYEEYNRLLDVDPTLRRAWRVMRQTLLSATWDFERVDDSLLALQVTSYLEEVLGVSGAPCMMRRSWEEVLGTQLLYTMHGFRYAEIEWTTAKSPSLGRLLVYVADLHDCDPQAHDQWIIRDGRTLEGIIQRATSGQPGPTAVDVDKLWLVSLDPVGSDPEGVGLLRSAWWWAKAHTMAANMLVTATERWALPTPRITVDYSVATEQGLDNPLSPDDSPGGSTLLDAAIDAAKVQAENYVGGQQAYLIDNPAVSFNTFGEGAFNPDGVLRFLEYADQQKAASTLTQFMSLGLSDVGSRAVGQVHESVFRRSCINVLDQVAATWMQQVGRQLVVWNFGEAALAVMPKLVHRGLDVSELAEALAVLPDLKREGFIDEAAVGKIADRVVEHLGLYNRGQAVNVGAE